MCIDFNFYLLCFLHTFTCIYCCVFYSYRVELYLVYQFHSLCKKKKKKKKKKLYIIIHTSKRYSVGLAYPAARGNNVVILQYPICICASSARRTR